MNFDRLVTLAAWGFAMARRRPRTYPLQTGSHSASLSAVQRSWVYLVDCCTPVSDIPSRRHLRSATRHQLTVYTTLPAQHFRSSGLLCRRSDGLRDPALTSNSLDNRWRRICFDATTQHTQRSRDASWLCTIWICYWHWHWQEFDFTQSVYNLTFVSKMIVSNWQKKTSAKHETPEAIKQHNFLRREIKRKTEIQGILSCLSLREYWTQL